MARGHVWVMRAVALAILGVLAVGAISASAGTSSTTFTGAVSIYTTRAVSHTFTAPAGSTVSMRLGWVSSSANLYLTARRADGSLIAASRTSEHPKLLSFVVPSTGTFVGRVRANRGGSSFTLAVTVAGGNHAPVVKADSATTSEGTAVALAPLANDSDPDGDALSLKSVTAPGHGSVARTPDGRLTYTPAAGFSGSDSFGYTACDDGTPAICAGATVSVSVRTAAPPPPPAGTLRWAPPVLNNPITIALPANGGVTLNLDNSKDYIIRYPNVRRVGALRILGGRNIVIIGGASTIAPHPGTGIRNIQLIDKPGVMDGRIIHIEGLDINGSGGGEADGIGIGTPSAIVQLEDDRITGLIGHLASTHADVIQTWGGVKQLRVYDLTGSSHYNNLYLRRENSPLSPAIGPVTLDHVNLFGYVNPAGWDIPATIRAMSIGTQPANGDCDASHRHCGPSNNDSSTNCRLGGAVSLNDMYGAPPGGGRLQRFMWPTDLMQAAGCASRLSADGHSATWPSMDVSGSMRLGTPPGGDFVPAGSVGVGYVSPGYQTR